MYVFSNSVFCMRGFSNVCVAVGFEICGCF